MTTGQTKEDVELDIMQEEKGNYEDKETGVEEDDDSNVIVDAGLEQLAKFTKLVAPSFLLFALYAVVALILSFAGVNDGWLIFLILCGGNLFFSLAGAAGIYKWGSVEDQIDVFKEQNNKYEQEIFELKGTREKLHEQVNGLQEVTGKLKRNMGDLQESMAQFDELKNSLSSIVGQGEEIEDLVNSVNGMYDNMRDTVLQNKRADILSTYYEASLRDGQEGMSAGEYKRFLGPLDKDTRERFLSYGSFKDIAGDDDIIDLQEFQALVDRLLQDCEQELMQGAM